MAAPVAFDTGLLDPPPDDFQMFGAPDAERERDRALNVENYQKIVKHHTWGLRYTIQGRKTKGKFFALLKKIVFNQQPHLRATDWRSFILCECDAGPGLLELRYNAPQISRWNPGGATAGTAAVPSLVTTSHMFAPNPPRQRQTQATSRASNQHRHMQYNPQPPQTPATGNLFNPSPTSNQLSPYPGEFQAANQPDTDSSNGMPNSQLGPTNLVSADPGSSNPPIPCLPEINMSLDTTLFGDQEDQPEGQLEGQPEWQPEDQQEDQPIVFDKDQLPIVETLEREILRYTYRGLERHPLAFPIGARPLLTATSPEDFSNSPAAFPGVLGVKLIRDSLGLKSRLDPEGSLYSYRGRGPISSKNSSSVDCAIVAGKLLDAGSTIVDRGNDEKWAASLSPVEQAFIEATTLNWDAFSENFSVESRNDFWKLLNGGLNNHEAPGPRRPFRFGECLPPATLWDVCTNSFQQFRVSYEKTWAICPCNNNGPNPETPYVVQSISPFYHENDRLGVRMQVLFDRFFGQPEPRTCGLCGTNRDVLSKSFDELPMRLVVKLDQRVLPRHHTSNDIYFNYYDRQNGNKQTIASYRWLGGVYRAPGCETARYAVFWTDDKRGEPVTGQLCMYDGTQNSGVIVGNIPPADEERIPSEWWANGSPPLLFYERIINPSLDTLSIARDAVNNMMQAVKKKSMMLANHTQWKKTNIPLDAEPPRRQYLNGSPPVSEIGDVDDVDEEPTAKVMPLDLETSTLPKPSDAISRATYDTQQVQMTNGQYSTGGAESQHVQGPQSLEQQGQAYIRPQAELQTPPPFSLHSQPQSQPKIQKEPQTEARNFSTLEAQNAAFMQELETDSFPLGHETHNYLSPKHHSRSPSQGQQIAVTDQFPDSAVSLPRSTDSLQQKPQGQYDPLLNVGIPLRLNDDGKRQRSPSDNFYGAGWSDASSSLKKRRYE